MKIDVKQAAKLLKEKDNIVIISHKLPDGDTLGSATALCYALRLLGKKANVKCNNVHGDKFNYLYRSYANMNFKDEFIVSVDIADTTLLGKNMQNYKEIIDLSIDHHESNKMYAKANLVDAAAAATCEIIYDIIVELGVPFNSNIANSIFTGIITDTGCFRYTNTTIKTHEIAAELMKHSTETISILKSLFENKTRGRIEIEKFVLNTMEFFCDNKIAVISLPLDEIEHSGVSEDELDGIAAMPKTVVGVDIAITLKERTDNKYKVSLRTSEGINASEICREFYGGGHPRAAGCIIDGTFDVVKKKIIDVSKSHLYEKGK